MTTTRRAVLASGSFLTSAALLRNVSIAQPVDAGGAPEPISGLLESAIEAYIYGYPLVTMETTRRVMTNVEKPAGDGFGTFRHSIPIDENNELITTQSPNAVTLAHHS